MRRARGFMLAATLAGSLGLVHPRERVADPLTPLGFSAARAAAQREAEKRLAATLSTQRLSEFHRLLTRRPHPARTPAGRHVAEQIVGTLRGFGLATQVHAYDAYLSHPKRIRLTLLKPTRQTLPVHERSDPRDPDTANAELTPGFIAYSASGQARGQVVYVNYGLPADYAALEAAGVNVRGGIVLARYGKAHRAVKVFTAEQRGARGILIYSDPADDGYAQGEAWPRGSWRASWFLQRGNAKYSWFWHGDPLTPHVAAKRPATRLKPDEVPTLPRIPAVAISWSAAQRILAALGGPVVPRGFQGSLPFTYHAGPGPAAVAMDVQMESGLRPIWNVVARIDGREEQERWVILGTHHDAWTFGGVDPGSAAAVLLELARALREMEKSGWQPRRSIVLAFWDAEEYGLVGSTEFAEEFASELREKGVAYVNSDLYLAGRFEAGGSASLRDFVVEVASAVVHPAGAGSVYAHWRESAWQRLSPGEKKRRAEATSGAGLEVELEPLGSGADFVPFQDYLGLPVLSLEFGLEGSYGAYHSAYDTRFYMEKFGDPGWRYARALGEVLGRVAMRLASADVLPFRFSHTAEKLEDYLRQLEEENADAESRQYLGELGLEGVRERLAAFHQQAQAFDGESAAKLKSNSLGPDILGQLNDHLAQAEKNFAVDYPVAAHWAAEKNRLEPSARSGQHPWYRHTIYGWNIHALYSGQTLPGLQRALQHRDSGAFAAERARLEYALERATQELAQANALVR